MSIMRSTPTDSPAARARTAALVCAIALGGLAGGASASFGSDTPEPPAQPCPPSTPDTPDTPTAPGTTCTPEDPSDPSEPPVGGQTPSAPPAQAKPSKLDPFPVVVVAGRDARRTARVTELKVRGPPDARVVVRCLGDGCPMRRAEARIPRSKSLRVRRAQRIYRVGTRLQIRVTGKDRIGKYTQIRFRSNRIPARTDACLQPGDTRPSPCPD